MNFCNMAVEVLRITNDGESLAPHDLKLTELAINGFLSEAGEVAFAELHRNATKPEGYTVPWFLGIEHMTRDHQRYVYWKGRMVEHYDHDFWQQPGWQEDMRADAERLAAKCRAVEASGKAPSVATIVFDNRPDEEATLEEFYA